MRISTNQIYDAGVSSLQRGQSALYKLQNQLSSNKRVLTPEDDPVAAAQALIVTQSKQVNAQHVDNQSTATSQLGLVDSQLSSLVKVLQNVRDKTVQAGSTGSLSSSDRAAIATELESNLSEMVGIANSQNGAGDYLFSGYKGATLPFALDAGGAYQYSGDDGQRLLQVSSSRQMAINVAGSDVFMNAKGGNGSFVTATKDVVVSSSNVALVGTASVLNQTQWDAALKNPAAGQPLEIRFSAPVLPAVPPAVSYGIYDPVSNSTTGPFPYAAGSAIQMQTAAVNFGAQVIVTGVPVAGDSVTIQPSSNAGTATISAGSVVDQQKWAQAVNNPLAGQPLEIRFSVVAGVTTYGIYDPVSNATSVPVPNTYTAGMAIPLKTSAGVDFGAQVVVSGQPQNGDRFTVTPSSSQSVFQTVQSLIGILRSPVGTAAYSTTEYTNELGAQLTNLDQALNNVGRVQATVGSNMKELDSLGNTSSDLDLQYQSTLGDLVGLDYYQAMSDFTMQKTALEAAQKSFVEISGLSLFNYM